jgi:hypothetical protein
LQQKLIVSWHFIEICRAAAKSMAASALDKP